MAIFNYSKRYVAQKGGADRVFSDAALDAKGEVTWDMAIANIKGRLPAPDLVHSLPNTMRVHLASVDRATVKENTLPKANLSSTHR